MSEAHDWAALKRLAEAATQHQEEWWETTALRVDCGMDYPDAAYIAAAHPQAVLALLAALERAEAERDAMAQALTEANRACEFIAQQRDAARAEAAQMRAHVNHLEELLNTTEAERDAARLKAAVVEAELEWLVKTDTAQEPGHD